LKENFQGSDKEDDKDRNKEGSEERSRESQKKIEEGTPSLAFC